MKKSILFLFILFCYACDYTNHSLKVKNKSWRKISVVYADKKGGKATENNIAFYITDYNVIAPDSTKDIAIMGTDDVWHKFINNSADKKLYLFIFNTDSLIKYNSTNYSINDLIYKNKYLKRFDYTEQQLIDKHYLVYFK